MTDILAVSGQQHLLAEGPFWCDRHNTLYWVDIPAREVWCWKQAKNEYQHWVFEQKVSAVFTTQSHRLLLCMADGVAYFDPVTEVLEPLCKLDEDRPNNRSNDAKCDQNGRLYVGTMDDNEALQTGRLWAVDERGNAVCLLDDIGISNTLAWDESRDRFYFADSMQGKIHAYPWTTFSDVRADAAFIETSAGVAPDGSCIDAQGNLWNAQWGGGCVVCYNPDGNEIHRIELPFNRPTSCAFGGPDMTTLFITSASVGGSDAVVETLAGQVIAIDLLSYFGQTIKGLPSQSFCGA